MSITLGQLHYITPRASDDMLADATLCIFIEYLGNTYSITPAQLRSMLDIDTPINQPSTNTTSVTEVIK